MAEESNRKSSQEEQYYDSDSYNCRGSSEVYILYHAESESDETMNDLPDPLKG